MGRNGGKQRHEGHQRYRTLDGTVVPGVTTITGVMDKPALVGWANRLGLQGVDSTSYVDSLAAAGTLAHYLAECQMIGCEPEQEYLDTFSKVDMDHAETSLAKFTEWAKTRTIEVLGHEMQLVSERHKYGGTCDLYARVDGVLTLIDLKTCKALYGRGDEKFTQLAGYQLLLEENGHEVQESYILRLGRSPDEGFEYAASPDPALHAERFLVCRSLYGLNARLK